MDLQLEHIKCVVVVADSLAPGLQANAASVITMTLGQRCAELVGPDVKDSDGVIHAGVVRVPVPILTAPPEQIGTIWQRSDTDGPVRVGFTALAQSCRSYEEYVDRLGTTSTADLHFVGVGLYGNKKDVNRMVGSLPLLR